MATVGKGCRFRVTTWCQLSQILLLGVLVLLVLLQLVRPCSAFVTAKSSRTRRPEQSTATTGETRTLTTRLSLSTATVESSTSTDEAFASLTEKPPFPIPDPTADPNDDVFRWVRRNLSVDTQNWLRDSGFCRSLQDSLLLLGVPAIVKAYPTSIQDHIRLSSSSSSKPPFWNWMLKLFIKSEETKVKTDFETVSYGNGHALQTMDLIKVIDAKKEDNHWVIFCHGGAWGSGRPWIYRHVTLPFVARGINVCVWGYRTYPTGRLEEQMEDLVLAVQELRSRERPSRLSLIGHSSGAHVALCTALMNSQQDQEENDAEGAIESSELWDEMIGLAGVNDIVAHFDYEIGRGVEQISSMLPACGGKDSRGVNSSPSRILKNYYEKLPNKWGFSKSKKPRLLPRTLLVHGVKDVISPYTQAWNFTQIASAVGEDVELKLFEEKGHVDVLLELMWGGDTQDKVVEWLGA